MCHIFTFLTDRLPGKDLSIHRIHKIGCEVDFIYQHSSTHIRVEGNRKQITWQRMLNLRITYKLPSTRDHYNAFNHKQVRKRNVAEYMWKIKKRRFNFRLQQTTGNNGMSNKQFCLEHKDAVTQSLKAEAWALWANNKKYMEGKCECGDSETV